MTFNLYKRFKAYQALKKLEKQRNKPIRSLINFKKKFPNFSIGINCYGVPHIKFQHPNAKLSIGSYCSIAKNVQIFLGGIHRADWVSTYPFHAFKLEANHIKNGEMTNGDVIIGNDVWICENVIILSGITIGDGAVVANGAVVTKNIEAYSIVGGNPAKHIRWRFEEATRLALLESAWWDWPEKEILSVIDLICTENISDFLTYAKTRIQNKHD